MEIIRLHPLAQSEHRQTHSSFLERLFNASFPAVQRPRLGPQLAELVAAGGYPAALQRPTAVRRARWYRDYVQAIVERDVRDLARIQALDVMPRLLALFPARQRD